MNRVSARRTDVLSEAQSIEPLSPSVANLSRNFLVSGHRDPELARVHEASNVLF